LASKESLAGRNSESGERKGPNPTRLNRLRDMMMIAGGEIPLAGLEEDLNNVRALIRSGGARLKVVEWPWGLEFHLVGAVPPQTDSLEAEPTPISCQARQRLEGSY
jgi:hypothetical protein